MLAEKTAETNSALGIVPPIVPSAPDDIKSAAIIGPWRLRVVFNDGVEGEIDIERFINSPDAGSFALLRDPELSKRRSSTAALSHGPLGTTNLRIWI